MQAVLTDAFGAGGWSMLPVDKPVLNGKNMSQDFVLVGLGRFVSKARGEQDYIEKNPKSSYATASEGMHTNAVMRCCKDLGVYYEIFDPRWRRWWKKEYARMVQVLNFKDHKNQWIWLRKDADPEYPFKWMDRNQQSGTATARPATQAPSGRPTSPPPTAQSSAAGATPGGAQTQRS